MDIYKRFTIFWSIFQSYSTIRNICFPVSRFPVVLGIGRIEAAACFCITGSNFESHNYFLGIFRIYSPVSTRRTVFFPCTGFLGNSCFYFAGSGLLTGFCRSLGRFCRILCGFRWILYRFFCRFFSRCHYHSRLTQEVEWISHFRSRTYNIGSRLVRAAVQISQTSTSKCKAAVIIQSRFCILILVGMVFIVAGCVNTADKCAVQSIFCFRIIGKVSGVGSSVMIVCRPFVAVTNQEAVTQRISAENIIHLPFCTRCIRRRSISVSRSQCAHLKRTVITCSTPAITVVFAFADTASVIDFIFKFRLKSSVFGSLIH